MGKGVKATCEFPSAAFFSTSPMEMPLHMLIAFTYLPGFVTNLAELTPRQVVSMYQLNFCNLPKLCKVRFERELP
jgi:hypothetical protein